MQPREKADILRDLINTRAELDFYKNRKEEKIQMLRSIERHILDNEDIMLKLNKEMEETNEHDHDNTTQHPR